MNFWDEMDFFWGDTVERKEDSTVHNLYTQEPHPCDDCDKKCVGKMCLDARHYEAHGVYRNEFREPHEWIWQQSVEEYENTQPHGQIAATPYYEPARELVMSGLSVKDTADKLGITMNMVRRYCNRPRAGDPEVSPKITRQANVSELLRAWK